MKRRDRWSRNVLKLSPALRRKKRCGRQSDVDGTMSEYQDTPEKAFLHPRAFSLLEESRELGPTGVCTSRSLVSAAQMVNVPGIVYVANKGLERCVGLPNEGGEI